ncbi:hypothetical protein ACFX13_031074 [Malus domestica]|uniref:ABC transporter domain-containing protein n=1 Tax=Malus domestica TaxID=3750 RepID=A0A498K7K9_MALDO|nr:hypothetical protein DVH24_003979 [Malus domestica]
MVAIVLIQRNRHALIGRAMDDIIWRRFSSFLKNDPVVDSFDVTENLALQSRYMLSGGQKSRVAFAKTASKKPHIILLIGSMDELWLVSEGRIQPFHGSLEDYKKIPQSSWEKSYQHFIHHSDFENIAIELKHVLSQVCCCKFFCFIIGGLMFLP